MVEVQSANYGWLYKHTPAVRTVIDFIARNVAQLGLRLYERTTDTERQQVYDHLAAEAIRYPNPITPGEQFIFSMVVEWLVYNNAYALKLRRSPSQSPLIYVLPTSNVGVIGQNYLQPEGYRVWNSDGLYEDFKVEDMIHWRGHSPTDMRQGFSPLETLRKLLMEDAAAATANLELTKAGYAPPGYLSRPVEAPSWDGQKAPERVAEDWRKAMAQPGRNIPVLEEGMRFEAFGISPKDAQALEGRRFTEESVAGIYGVPIGLLNPKGTQALLSDQRQQFYADVLPPICEQFASYLDLHILQAEYDRTDLYFEFDLDEKLQGESRISTYVSAAGGPIYTRDEIRRKLNLPPLPDGAGEEIITPLNVELGGKPSPAVMPVPDPNTPAQDGSHRDGNPPLAASVNHKQLEASTKPVRAADMARQRRNIDEAKAVFVDHYRRQQSVMTSKNHKSAANARWNRELGDNLEKLVRSIVEREGGFYVARLGGHDFDMRQVEHYIAAMTAGTAEGVNAATQRDITETTLQDAFNRAINQRADVAGTSIGTRATLFARKEAAKQAPHTERRLQTWVANTERHADLDGVSVPLDSDWGGIEPGSEPHCSCTATIS